MLALLGLPKEPWPPAAWSPEPWKCYYNVAADAFSPVSSIVEPPWFGTVPGILEHLEFGGQHLWLVVVVIKPFLKHFCFVSGAHYKLRETTGFREQGLERMFGRCYMANIVPLYIMTLQVQNDINHPGDECMRQHFFNWCHSMCCFHFILVEHLYVACRGQVHMLIRFYPALAIRGSSTKVLPR